MRERGCFSTTTLAQPRRPLHPSPSRLLIDARVAGLKSLYGFVLSWARSTVAPFSFPHPHTNLHLRKVYHAYRMAWATHAPRTWDIELSLTFATIAAPMRNTKTTSKTNSRQFRAITCLPCLWAYNCDGTLWFQPSKLSYARLSVRYACRGCALRRI